MYLGKDLNEFIKKETGLDVNINASKEMRFNQHDVRQVLKIYKAWCDCIPKQNRAILLKTLLNDLNRLHCCAVCGNPASPCFIGKLAECTPEGQISIYKYTSYQLNTSHIRIISNASSKFI